MMPVTDVVPIHGIKDHEWVVFRGISTQKPHVYQRIIGVGSIHREILRWREYVINGSLKIYRIFAQITLVFLIARRVGRFGLEATLCHV